MDKPMVQSKVAWGAVIAGISEIAMIVSTAMQQGIAIDYFTLAVKVVGVIGLVIAAIGARQIAGKILVK
jgi:hypothetical protein